MDKIAEEVRRRVWNYYRLKALKEVSGDWSVIWDGMVLKYMERL